MSAEADKSIHRVDIGVEDGRHQEHLDASRRVPTGEAKAASHGEPLPRRGFGAWHREAPVARANTREAELPGQRPFPLQQLQSEAVLLGERREKYQVN